MGLSRRGELGEQARKGCPNLEGHRGQLGGRDGTAAPPRLSGRLPLPQNRVQGTEARTGEFPDPHGGQGLAEARKRGDGESQGWMEGSQWS